MKTRNISALLICAILAACGGGGGGSSAVPSHPTTSGQGLVKFTFKVPVKSKQIRRAKFIGGKYVSPATLGLGLSFSTTTLTPSQITTPNFALDLSVCLPTAFSTCVTNPDGSQTFTLQAPVPAGNYTFEVATWDSSPTSGTTFNGNQLSSAIVPLTVTAGGAPQSPSFVLNGVPASIAFMPAPNQLHVNQTTAGTVIVGNSAGEFFFNVLDADGFIITGQGAPTLSATDATGSFALVQNAANPNMWSATALAPAMAQSSVTLILAATSPVGSGIPTLNATPVLLPSPELWIGSSSVLGYPLTYTFGATPSVAIGGTMDNLAIAATNGIALDPSGNLFVGEGPAQVNLFSAASYLTPPIDTGSVVNTGSGGSLVGGMAIDSNDFLYVPDAHNPASNGAILVYNNSVPLGTLASVAFGVTSQPTSYMVGSGTVTGGGTSINAPLSIAIAPSTAAIPASLQGTVWVAGPSGVEVFKNTGTGLTDLGTAIAAGDGGDQAVAIGSDGTVWVYDVKSGYLYAGAISTSFPISFPIDGTVVAAASTQMATDAIGNVWLPTSSGYVYPYSLVGGAVTQGSASIYTSSPGTGIYLTP